MVSHVACERYVLACGRRRDGRPDRCVALILELMALSVGVVVVLLVLTIGVGSLPSPSSGDTDVAGGGQ